MAKSLTPIVGLAVVVALALAAVFGSMSLANPAMAAIGQPADAELTERMDSPQAAPSDLMVVTTDATVTLSWDDQDDTGPTNWQIRSRFKSVADFSPPRDSTDSNVTITDGVTGDVEDDTPDVTAAVAGLTNGTEYCFEVRYLAGDGTPGAWSKEICATPSAAPTNQVTGVMAEGSADGGVELSWSYTAPTGDADVQATGFQYRMRTSCIDNSVSTNNQCTDSAANPPVATQPADDVAAGDWSMWMTIKGGADATMAQIKLSDDVKAGTSYDFQVRSAAGSTGGTAVPAATDFDDTADNAIATAMEAPVPPIDPELAANSTDPGKNTRYTIKFTANGNVDSGTEELVIELEDFGFPDDGIDNDDVIIRVQRGTGIQAGEDSNNFSEPSNPQDIDVSGEKLRIVLDDTNPVTDYKEGIADRDVVTITISTNAGVSNPTEGGGYPAVITGGSGDDKLMAITTAELMVPLLIELDENDGGRGDTVTVTAKGFKNGHTMSFWLDRNMNFKRDQATEAVLCSAQVMSDDTASCSFEISNPPFTGGVGGPTQMVVDDDGDDKCAMTGPRDCNFVNGADGTGNVVTELTNDQMFELKAAIKLSPAAGSVGDSVQVQMTDFPPGASVSSLTIASIDVPGVSFSADPRGNGSFSFTIPNNVPQGIEELEVTAGGVKADEKITIAGPRIQVTPETVIANQRVSLVGSGFTRASYVCCTDPDGPSGGEHQAPVMTFGGEVIPPDRINDGNPVLVDNGGNWSASVNLPLSSATTASGTKELQVTDSKGRVGSVDISIPAREVEVTPSISRVGTTIVVRGKYFPSRNDGGDPFNVTLTYKATSGSETRVSATPDASGNFEAEMNVPTGASIPSTNTIQVEFEESDGEKVTTNIPHTVPEGTISVSDTRGPAGTVITVSGEGFKNFVPISRVTVGDLEVTPSPRPSTNSQGMVEFDITIPGLEVGIQTIEVDVGDTTASVGFTVSLSSERGAATQVAVGLEELGDNLVSVWHFNNDSKVWSFYDPTLEEGNTLSYLYAGEPYFIRIKSNQEVILNQETRSLTCVGGNCWNPIVW